MPTQITMTQSRGFQNSSGGASQYLSPQRDMVQPRTPTQVHALPQSSFIRSPQPIEATITREKTVVRQRTRTQAQDTYYMVSAAIVSLCSLIPSWVYAAVTRTGDYNTSFWHNYDGYIQGFPLYTPDAIRMRLYETALIVHGGFILSYFLCNLFQTAGLVHLILVVVLVLISPGIFFGLMKQKPTIGDSSSWVKYAPGTFTTNFAQVGCLFQTIWLAWMIMGSATIRFNNVTMTRGVGLAIQIVCLCVCFGVSLGASLGYNVTGANSKWEEFYLIVGMICSFFIVLLIIF